MSLLCRLGFHDFPIPPHKRPWGLWEDFEIECIKGCGARSIFTCITAPHDQHWKNKHPEPKRG